MEAAGLDAGQRKLATMYALLNRVYWTCENGVQFNSNTTAQVDWAANRETRKIVRGLFEELRAGR